MRKRGLLFRLGEVSKGSGPALTSQTRRKKRRRREGESHGAEEDKEERRLVSTPASASAAKKVNASSLAAAAASPMETIKPWGIASPVHKAAASVLGSLMAGRGRSLKALTLFSSSPSNSNPSSNSKTPTFSSSSTTPGARRATHAVASETLRRLEQLTLALKAAGYGSTMAAAEEEDGGKKTGSGGGPRPPPPPLSGATVARRLPRPAALVLAYDLLFGQGLRPVGPAERALLRAEDALRAAVAAAAGGGGAAREHERRAATATAAATAVAAPLAPPLLPPPLLRDSHPRPARVNSLKWTLPEALACFRKEKNGEGKQQQVKKVERDPLVDGVLLFPPRTDLHEHPSVLSGRLILQSRASCLPAVALNPQKGWTVVDACAAPGNKTTHLAALVGETGRVLAFDRDPRRLGTLVRAADRAGASRIVKARVADFLKLDPFGDEFASVRAVLLDPSCSGSGTASADVDASISAAAVAAAEDDLAAKEEKGEEEEREREKRRKRRRLDKLAEFQLSALKHALRFPNARRVAYSTCSVHAEENERVVAAALAWLSGGEGEARGDGEAGEEEKKKRRKKERKKAGSPSDAAAAVATSSSPSSLSLPKGWRLARALPEWPTRGISEGEGAEGEEGGCLLSLSPDDAAKVLRAHPATDATDGFFVAVFERCEGDGER